MFFFRWCCRKTFLKHWLIVKLCTPHFYGNFSCRSFHSTQFPTAHCSNQNVVLVSACGEKSKKSSIRHFPINTGMYVNLSIFWESIDAHQYYSGQKKRPLEAGNVGGGIHKTQIHKTVIICFSSCTNTHKKTHEHRSIQGITR